MTEMTRRELLLSGFALSATSLAAQSPLAAAGSLLDSDVELRSAEVPVPNTSRERTLFDFGWKFFLGNGCDPSHDLNFGRDQGDFSKSGGFNFAQANFDDTSWRVLDLPHDWAVELPFVHDDSLMSHGYKPLGRRYPETSVGWYRKAFEIPTTDVKRCICVEFDGVFRDALVFVNGYFIGRSDSGYVPFHFDITDFIQYGGMNCVAVRVDASFGDGWFYEGAGIYRHVWLTKRDPLHLGDSESWVRSDVKPGFAALHLRTVIHNDSDKTATRGVSWQLFDTAGKNIGAATAAAQPIPAHGCIEFTAMCNLENPQLWSPEAPTLYSAMVSVDAHGSASDAERIDFGVRTLKFDPANGFFLNGKVLKIKGTCNHQDHAGVGVALPDALQRYRLSVLREMGSNAVRTSHNMPTPEWVNACDRMGMMMMCETRIMSSNPEAIAQMETMVRRYRNSPSIILWSMGNEEGMLQKTEQGQRVMAEMVARCHALDPTRLCTAAVNGSYGKGISKELDVLGFNYNLSAIDEYHKEHPDQPLVGTETASTVSTRGIYSTDPLRNWVSSYDVNRPDWAELSEEWWKFYAARQWLAGGFVWTGFDYRGEPTPYGWPSISSQFGVVDTCGFTKDNYYYYKAWWKQEPLLHLFPHWNWTGREGESIAVWVYSNLDEVELFINGKSVGSKTVEPLTHLEWQVRYVPGLIEARGKKNGKVVLITRRETTGAPETIRLTPDRTVIDADGQDVAIVSVEVLDQQGRAVPTASNLIHFNVVGEGRLIGVGNGDPNCQESDKEQKRSLFNGLAQVLVQASKNAGSITIEASTLRLVPASLTVQTMEHTER